MVNTECYYVNANGHAPLFITETIKKGDDCLQKSPEETDSAKGEGGTQRKVVWQPNASKESIKCYDL